MLRWSPVVIQELKILTIQPFFASYSILNQYLIDGKIDAEFKWMLSFYSSWDYTILPFSENKLEALTAFVKGVDTSILSCPKNQLPKGTMDNRGQMGIYWISMSVEKKIM